MPSCSHTGQRCPVILPDKAMCQLVLEDAGQLVGDAVQALDWNANAAVVERPHPAWRAGDIHEGLICVQNHADGLGRLIIQCG